MNKKLIKASEEYKSWFVNDALPLWSSKAINSVNGASYERLLNNGEPDLSANVRLRVQARQMFVFCLATELKWMSGGENIVSRMAEFVDSCGRHPAGGYVHLLDTHYDVIDKKQDLYDHAFFLLANAWRFRVFKQESALEDANNILGLLNNKFSMLNGGWTEGDYETDRRRQNPHMHLFEAFLALYEASDNKKWLELAGEMFALFENYFFDKKNAALLEYFDDDWSPLKGEDGLIIEPGHMMEWVWLLRNFSRHSGVDVDACADELYKKALNYGMAENGLMFDELFLDGSIKKASKRCWPMTELIKASIAQAKAGRTECEEVAANALVALKKHYLTVSTAGAYIDQLDENDQVVVDFAPASTLYHLIVAAAESDAYVTSN